MNTGNAAPIAISTTFGRLADAREHSSRNGNHAIVGTERTATMRGREQDAGGARSRHERPQQRAGRRSQEEPEQHALDRDRRVLEQHPALREIGAGQHDVLRRREPAGR